MDFTTSGGGSYERPTPGAYTGILVGVAEGGTHEGTYGTRKRLILRWELHRRKGPSLGADGNVHTVTCPYTATLNEKSNLYPVIRAHLGTLGPNARTTSKDWLGKAARLTLEDDGNGHVNVANIAPLDPEEDEVPRQISESEHWEIRDGVAGVQPPRWAKWLIMKSNEWPEIDAALGGQPNTGPARPRTPASAGGYGYGVPPKPALLDPRLSKLTVAAAPDQAGGEDEIPF